MAVTRPNYGISRIDQPDKKNHGYYVRITHNGKTQQKYFPDKACGSKTKALKLAQEFRDKIVKKLPKAKRAAAACKRRNVKQSGVVGVTHVLSRSTGGKAYEYWQAAWDEDGVRRTAKFSIAKYKNGPALEMAKKKVRAMKRKHR